MYRCLSLISFTDQAIREIGSTIERANRFRSAVEEAGGNVVGLYWAVGEVDGAVVFEAPDEQSATKLLLTLANDGFVRTRTVRLFDSEELQSILAS